MFTITRDSDSYVSGTDIQVTVTLKDGQGNGATGQTALLTATTVSVPNATAKSGSGWTDNRDGTYSRTYIASTAGSNLTAAVKLGGWNAAQQSGAYAITPETEAPAAINTQLSAYTFPQASEEGYFPATGFTGATFTIVPKDGKSASDYTRASDAGWVSVTAGVVKFTGKGTGNKVTITGTQTGGQGNTIRYSFTLKVWFVNNGSTVMNWSDANTYCSSLPGYRMSTMQQFSYFGYRGEGGGLWGEWGNLMNYNGAGFLPRYYWAKEQNEIDTHYVAQMVYYYSVSIFKNSNMTYVVCSQSL